MYECVVRSVCVMGEREGGGRREEGGGRREEGGREGGREGEGREGEGRERGGRGTSISSPQRGWH